MQMRLVCNVRLLFVYLAFTVLQSLGQFSLNKEHLNKRLLDYTVANKSDIGLAQCAQICMFTQQCVSLNYCTNLHMCELNAIHSIDADPAEFVMDREWNYADVTAWPERISRTCENKTCAGNEECIPALPDAFCRRLPGCSVLGSIEHASLKPGGTLVNTTRKYTCDSGYAAIDGSQNIVKVCKSDETWTNEGEICHEMCSPGAYAHNRVKPCSSCEVGSYQPNQGQTECLSCPSGETTLYEGSLAETDCKGMCLPGSFSENTIDPCTLCPVGTYQPNEGQTGCEACPTGTSTLDQGTSAVSDCKEFCPPGSFSVNTFIPCLLCPVGSYEPNEGQSGCIPCPSGETTTEQGSTAVTDCKVMCTPGTYSDDSVEPCTPCPVGYYQSNSGQTVCSVCSVGLTTQYDGSSSDTDCKVYAIQQWVSSVVDFSSEFSSNDWCAAKVIGENDAYPGYGDLENSWAQETLDAHQYIEVSFATAVFITRVDIYETLSSGGVKRISMRDGYGDLHVLWETTNIQCIQQSRIFSPTLQTTSWKSSRVRLDIDCTVANNWVEIDAIKLHGTNW